MIYSDRLHVFWLNVHATDAGFAQADYRVSVSEVVSTSVHSPRHCAIRNGDIYWLVETTFTSMIQLAAGGQTVKSFQGGDVFDRGGIHAKSFSEPKSLRE